MATLTPPRTPPTTRQRMRSPGRGPLTAIAAVLALVAIATLLLIRSSSPDPVSTSPDEGPTRGQEVEVDRREGPAGSYDAATERRLSADAARWTAQAKALERGRQEEQQRQERADAAAGARWQALADRHTGR